MNYFSVLKAFGIIILVLAGGLSIPTAMAWYFGTNDLVGFVEAIGVALVAGGFLASLPRSKYDINHKDGFAIVTFGWISAAIIGGLPFYFSGVVPTFTDAFFEAMSGFTTTGSTVFSEIETLPPAILFWRSMTHWLGGMGIIVLSIAILPYLDIGGMSIFQAEVPGPTAEKLTPRIQDTAKILWMVYFLLTVVLVGLLWFAGMSFFDAVNHSFATMATGGFSTKNASVAAFNSPLIEWIITIFMLLAGTNFALHYRSLINKGSLKIYWKDSEFRFYLLILISAISIITVSLVLRTEHSLFKNFTDASFTVLSIITTTGFATADYEFWSISTRFILMFIMLIGGCAGSTGGGIKVVRILLIFKYIKMQLLKQIHPNLVRNIKLRRDSVAPEVISNILGFVFIYIAVMVVSIFLISLDAKDMMTSIGSTIACLSNIGPGFAEVGPTDNYAHFGLAAKWILSLDMLMGRLEIITVLILFMPQTWKK